MTTEFKPLLTSFTFPVSDITLKNRIVMAPMTTWSGNDDGTVSDQELTYYSKRSEGVSMLITACAYIMPQGKAFKGQIGVHADEMIPGLKQIADTIHKGGAKAVLQIHHGGRQSPPEVLPDHQPVSASNIPTVLPNAPIPRALTEDEIIETINAFGQATRRAIEAGFDGVEIHGANTYLVQQFFSPHSNRRDDHWGGSLEKRLNFPLAVATEVINTIKEYAKTPFLAGYRLSPEEMEEPGITINDTFVLVDKLSALKLDYLHISTMNFWGGSMRDKEDLRPPTQLIHEHLSNRIPIIGVGGIHTPTEALKIVNTSIPLIALGRALLMDPLWVEKLENNESELIQSTLKSSNQKQLVIPDAMWAGLISRKGWLPVE
ncbi:MAG: NADH-dependent flavin oxidoreductase [Bacteroidetes bacterium]|nr:NADH-dependent flavin oxidoreductase [Bacteroidota bacterium]